MGVFASHRPGIGLASFAIEASRAMAGLPFDLLRAQHARAVQAGWAPRSLLASSDFERALTALERLALGPLSRRV